jgi:DNA-binding NarL/FixJ family response regulator
MEGLLRVLAGEPSLAVVATAGTVSELLDGDIQASVVLLDAGIDTGQALGRNVRRLVERGYEVLVLSSDPSWDQARIGCGAGARGYITTSGCDLEQLAPALRDVAAGKGWVTPLLPSLVAESPSRPRPAQASAERKHKPVALSEREFEAVALYVSGVPKKIVALQLGVKVTTVDEFVKRARQKYKEAGRPAPTKVALLRRLIEDGYRLDDFPEPRPGAEASPRTLAA